MTLWHPIKHWTAVYVFMNYGRWSCRQWAERLLVLWLDRLGGPRELVAVLDDTTVKKSGRKIFGLGCYPDRTDKNPGASRRRVWGHCWVVLALLWERRRGQWFCFPLRALLFVPEKFRPALWRLATKIELAERPVRGLEAANRRVTLVVDNLYAKEALANLSVCGWPIRLISRLRSNAQLSELPPPRRPGQRGRTAKRGPKLSARQLSRRRSHCRRLKASIHGKTVTIQAFVGVVMPSPTLGDQPILVIIVPQRSGEKRNLLFSTDLQREPVRLLERYAARFKLEDAFDQLKTHGGFADCRPRSFQAQRRHVTLCLLTSSLLRLLSLTLRNAQSIEAEPWWHPAGPPSVTRLRRAVAKSLRISPGLWSDCKPVEIPPSRSPPRLR
ncbi:MAG: transposase [Candidatus Sumerlaeia bacterium]|nr:transposase [Candidatus Sumerlaeia bacterium]